jgi:cation:H+ antiporter
MDMILHIILLAGGIVILWKSAELLVAGAVGLAQKLGVSSLVVGLTVVAMGTSAPEVAASIAGVLRKVNGGDLAVGNVFGSNITNLALVGGLVALIRPLKVQKKTLFREIPVMILVSLLLWPLMRNEYITRPESAVLLAVFTGLIILTVYMARRESNQPARKVESHEPDMEHDKRSTQKNIIFILIGLVGLALGAEMAVEGAVYIGKEILGLSECVISLTIIAFGTSLPELVTCVVAALKGHHDISVGNLVGSNIFNTLLVTGAAGIVRPFEVSTRLAGGVDYWIMVTVSIVFAILILIGKLVLNRTYGLLLLCGYIGYIVYLLA